MSSRLSFWKYTSDPWRRIDAPTGIGTWKPVESLYRYQPAGSAVPPVAAGDLLADGAALVGAVVGRCVLCVFVGAPARPAALVGTGGATVAWPPSLPNALGMNTTRSVSRTSTMTPATSVWLRVSVVPKTVSPFFGGR